LERAGVLAVWQAGVLGEARIIKEPKEPLLLSNS